MRAKHGIAPGELLHDSGDTLTASSFFEVFPRLDRQPESGGKGLDRFHTANIGAGQDFVDAFILQGFRQTLRLTAASLDQRPQPVIAHPFLAVDSSGVPDNECGHAGAALSRPWQRRRREREWCFPHRTSIEMARWHADSPPQTSNASITPE